MVARHGIVRLFDPKLAERKRVGETLKQYFPKPLEGPVKLEIHAYFKAPCKAEIGKWKTTRADGDNLAKCLLDMLQSIAYLDDSQVVSLHVQKKWAAEASTHLFITDLS